MKDNSTLVHLYLFKGFDMDRFRTLYLAEISAHKEVVNINMFTGEEICKDVKEKSGVKNPQRIADKCKFLQDTIIRRANAKQDNKSFTLSSTILSKTMGEEYKSMLKILIEMGYIEMGDGQGGAGEHWYYEWGAHSHLYTMKDVEVYSLYEQNATIRKYKDSTIERIKDYKLNHIYPYIDEKYGESFRERYITSLNYFFIQDKEGFEAYLRDNGYDKEESSAYVYFQDVKFKLEQKEKDIYKVDSNGRMYHVLTNLSRDVKKYLNIDFSLDCKNSHPILFNYFIYLYHSISIKSSYNISTFLYSNIDRNKVSFTFSKSSSKLIHNVSDYLRNELINNNIEIKSVAKLKDDELVYIYLTSIGRLWDDVRESHPEYTRQEIKTLFFEQVLYSRSKTFYHKPFASEFAKMFPNVYELICRWKKPTENQDIEAYMKEQHLYAKKDYASLSIAMMNLEAQIFTTILKRMYAKRWNAVHIHDCIVVPITGNKNQPTEEPVREIMADVYKDFGLRPTFD